MSVGIQMPIEKKMVLKVDDWKTDTNWNTDIGISTKKEVPIYCLKTR